MGAEGETFQRMSFRGRQDMGDGFFRVARRDGVRMEEPDQLIQITIICGGFFRFLQFIFPRMN